jgi:hypothetical protein
VRRTRCSQARKESRDDKASSSCPDTRAPGLGRSRHKPTQTKPGPRAARCSALEHANTQARVDACALGLTRVGEHLRAQCGRAQRQSDSMPVSRSPTPQHMLFTARLPNACLRADTLAICTACGRAEDRGQGAASRPGPGFRQPSANQRRPFLADPRHLPRPTACSMQPQWGSVWGRRSYGFVTSMSKTSLRISAGTLGSQPHHIPESSIWNDLAPRRVNSHTCCPSYLK